jgi:ABC-type glycerol-3-phosphate transport system permease component
MYLGERPVLPISLLQLSERYYVEMSRLYGRQFLMSVPYVSILENTGMLLFIAPLLVLYIFVQRYFVEGIERTGIVG